MAKRLTVFYSWQSDSPSNLNRNFIEKALLQALKRLHSDAKLENALRDATVEIDRDTKGIAGSPPITETILKKINECAVFVADLTFVGQSKEGIEDASGKLRQFPNPNVLIEYGYAFRCHSHSKMIGIMNSAFGVPDAESLPFDLRHLRWPITYYLASPSDAEKDNQLEKLTKALVGAISLILSSETLTPDTAEKYSPRKSVTNAAIFFEKSHDLVGDHSAEFSVPEGAKAFLRVYAKILPPPIKSELEARKLAIDGKLRPMGDVKEHNFDRNTFGAIAIEPPVNGQVYRFTQLFLSREIWGLDAACVNSKRILYEMDGRTDYIPTVYIENQFITALRNYMNFAEKSLALPPPILVQAGLTGIKGYSITVNNLYIAGKSLRDDVTWEGEMPSYEVPAWEFLGPFFDRIWDSCGIERTAQHQTNLAKRFSR